MQQKMEKFKLIKPSKEYEGQAVEYIKEHIEYKSQIHGVGGLYRYLDNYDEWLQKLEQDRSIIPSEEKVPSETFFLIRESDDKIVGMINIRLSLNKKLRQTYGNIGYSIKPTERRKVYNKINLYLALLECQKHNIKKVMLTCDKNNLGSAKTIQTFDAELEREYYDSDIYNCFNQIYWIDVDSAIEKKKNIFEKNVV